MTTNENIWFAFTTLLWKIPVLVNITFFLTHLSYIDANIIQVLIIHTSIHLKHFWLILVVSFKNRSNSCCLNYETLVYFLKPNYYLNQTWFSWSIFYIHLVIIHCFNQTFTFISNFCVFCQYFFAFACRYKN